MRVRFQRLQRNDTDYELAFGVLLTPLFLAGCFVWTWFPRGFVPVCMFHRLSGLPCPSCGTFRCFALLARGQWAAAFRMQPLAVAIVCAALGYTLYSLVVVAGRLPRARVSGVSRAERRLAAGVIAAAVLLNWIYLIVSGI